MRVTEAGHLGRARRRRPDGRDEPADLGQGRRPRSSPAAICSTIDQADAAGEVPRRHHRHRRAADRDRATRPTPTRASASCSRTSSMSARWRRCSTSISAVIETAARRAVQGQGEADRRQHPGAAPGPRLCAAEPALPDRPAGRAHADKVGDRIFIDGNSRGGAGRGLWRRHGLRLVSDHAVDRRWPRPSPSYCEKLRVDPETGKHNFAIVQAEDEIASIGMVIGAGWNGARAFTATSGPGISLMTRVHRPGLLRRDPGGDLRRAARRPVHRHADAHPAGRL